MNKRGQLLYEGQGLPVVLYVIGIPVYIALLVLIVWLAFRVDISESAVGGWALFGASVFIINMIVQNSFTLYECQRVARILKTNGGLWGETYFNSHFCLKKTRPYEIKEYIPWDNFFISSILDKEIDHCKICLDGECVAIVPMDILKKSGYL